MHARAPAVAMRRRDRRGTAEDVQRPAAFLSREELAEKMHAINLKTSAATITASNFYLDDPKEMIARTSEEQITRMISSSGRPQTAPAVAKPRPIDPAAPTDAAPPPFVDPFVAMARQLGVELRLELKLRLGVWLGLRLTVYCWHGRCRIQSLGDVSLGVVTLPLGAVGNTSSSNECSM